MMLTAALLYTWETLTALLIFLLKSSTELPGISPKEESNVLFEVEKQNVNNEQISKLHLKFNSWDYYHHVCNGKNKMSQMTLHAFDATVLTTTAEKSPFFSIKQHITRHKSDCRMLQLIARYDMSSSSQGLLNKHEQSHVN